MVNHFRRVFLFFTWSIFSKIFKIVAIVALMQDLFCRNLAPTRPFRFPVL